MPDLRELRAFVEVAEQLSFTRAAQALGLSQQSVSRLVRDLEGELGVELLERTTREVRVTVAGTALLAEGREVLRSADAAFDAARRTGTGHAGTVRVGTTPPVGVTDRLAAADALRRGRPELSVAFHDVRPGDIHEALRDHEVDVLLTRVRSVGEDALSWAELRPTSAVVLLRSTHPLSDRESVGLGELDGHRLLVPSAVGTPYTDLLIAAFLERGATVAPVESRVTGGGMLATDLEDDRTVAVMPTGSASPGGVLGVPVGDFALPLRLLWPAGRPAEAVDRLVEAMGQTRAGG